MMEHMIVENRVINAKKNIKFGSVKKNISHIKVSLAPTQKTKKLLVNSTVRINI